MNRISKQKTDYGKRFQNKDRKNSYSEDNTIDDSLVAYINDLIEKRNEAKKNKDFATSDQIRDELLAKGIKLIDTREGTTFEIVK